jgi:enoyl-CoA hydratase
MSVVLTEIKNGVGIITLNRPEALNAINFEVARLMGNALETWRDDARVHMVLVQGVGGKAFCAGGDIKAVYQGILDQDKNITQDFYKYEYLVDRLIAQYPKPYIAMGAGVNMGGGMGLTMPAPYRLVSDNSLWAMPETRIGFFPDVGAGRFLNDCPGAIGIYLGLTGARMNAADAMYAGLATHYIPQDKCEIFHETLVQAETQNMPEEVLHEALEIFGEEPNMQSDLAMNRVNIDTCFSDQTMEGIIGHLECLGNDWAKDTLETLHQMSPTSLKVSLAMFGRGKRMTFTEVLQMDYTLSQKFIEGHDFREGVRALIIDKDKTPDWQPGTLEEVSDSMVDRYFK